MSTAVSIPVAKAVRQYDDGRTVTQLADEYGCSRSYMHKQLVAGGAKMRPRSSGNRQRSDGLRHCWKCKKDLPLDQFGKNKAEIGGLTRTCKPCAGKQQRKQRLKQKFGIDEKQYDSMLQEQGGVCAICGTAEYNSKNHRLAVDHDHATGAIRGLLCSMCNTSLGGFRDSPELLKRAADYLNKEKS